PRSTLFPYTTLFRSVHLDDVLVLQDQDDEQHQENERHRRGEPGSGRARSRKGAGRGGRRTLVLRRDVRPRWLRWGASTWALGRRTRLGADSTRDLGWLRRIAVPQR